MSSVVVLIPGMDSDTAKKSRQKQRKSLSLPPSSLSSLKPKSSLASSSSVHVALPALPPPQPSLLSSSSSSLRRHLLPSSSSSSSSLSSSSLLRNHSSSSSSASSSASEPSSSRSRKAHYDRPVDIANPFGDEPLYDSARRCPPSGQGLYTCRWRLRDKRGLLDPNGHRYCESQLMTPDLLARHVLTQHIAPDQDPNCKIACKWNSCFNRHYDPAGLAAHLVHDHFTNQMGLGYACILSHCPVKTVLSTFDALDRHYAQYHSGSLNNQIRKIWQPRRPHKDPRRATKLLAALQKLDIADKTRPKVPVSAAANPKFAPVNPKIRALRQIELKRRFMDPLNVEQGEGQDGQPWLRLQKRVEKRVQLEDSKQAADDAIFRATDYDQQDLDRLAPVSVEVTGDPTLRAIEAGLQNAEFYHAASSSSSQLSAARTLPGLTLPAPGSAQVVLPEPGLQPLEDSIGPTSLHSIEREMRFDAALSKQQRWADKLLNGNFFAPPRTMAQASFAEVEWDDVEPSDDWTPPLRLEPYHPASRSRFAAVEESVLDKPRAVRRPEAGPQPPTSGPTSATSNRLTSRSSSPTPVSGSDAALITQRVKREREDDDAKTQYGDREPPTAKVKLEHKVACIDLTGYSSDDLGEERTSQLRPVFVELEQNARAASIPQIGRRGGDAPTLERANSSSKAGARGGGRLASVA